MKLPNGYGSIIKLKGARRAPWAVRISYLEEQPDGTVKRKRKYLAYFAEQKSAISWPSTTMGLPSGSTSASWTPLLSRNSMKSGRSTGTA